MSLDELTREQKRAALNELRQALFQHELLVRKRRKLSPHADVVA